MVMTMVISFVLPPQLFSLIESNCEDPLSVSLPRRGLTGVGIYPHPSPLPFAGEGVCIDEKATQVLSF